MRYRVLGRTGLKVSQLGFGAMRLPMTGEGEKARVNRDLAIPMIHRAFEAGVNYIDTAVGYCNHDSQRAVGDALKGWREKIIASTKNPDYGEDEKSWWQNLEDSLERLGVDCIDIYNHHGLNWKSYTEQVEPRVGQWMHKALDQGLIGHICCSWHDGNEELKKIVDTGYVESITLPYHLLNCSLEDGIAYAARKNIGVVVMNPVGGGRLGATSDVLKDVIPGIQRIPELALRFVLSNPNVCVALSGMSTMEQVEQNLATANREAGLSNEDIRIIREHAERLKKIADLFCTGCGYCLPCPEKVAIPRIFEYYNLGRVYGLWDAAVKFYRDMGKLPWEQGAKKADACTECGECEKKCPQHIPICKQLKEVHARLTEPIAS